MATNVLFLLKNNYMFIAKTNNIHNDLIMDIYIYVYGCVCSVCGVDCINTVNRNHQQTFEV